MAVAFQWVLPALPSQLGFELSDVLIAGASGYGCAGYLRQARSHRGRARAGFIAGCAAAGMWSLANLLFLLTAYGLPHRSGRLVGDILSLAAAVAVPVGLLLLAPPLHGMARFRRLIDVAAVSGATFALTWQFVLLPSLHRMGSGPTALAAAQTLPEVIACAIALVTMAATAGGNSNHALRLLALATVVLAVTALLSLRNGMEGSPWYATGVGGGYVFAAGLMAMASREDMPGGSTASVRRLVASAWVLLAYAPIVGAVAATAVLQLRTGTIGPVVVWVLLGTFSLVLLRQFLTLATVSALAVRLAAQTEELAHQAHHDALTGLPNRAAFYAAGATALTGGERPIMIMLIDLDGFKAVNDTLGHAAGDEVLVAVSARLLAALRPDDVVARLGGDEFAVLLTDVPVQTGIGTAKRVVHSLSEPMRIHSTDVAVGCSIGVTTAAGGADDISALIREADLAMYAAKSHGKGVIRVYEPPRRVVPPPVAVAGTSVAGGSIS
ncbi:GGDEF domain-containing protein [Actinoplanes nipponensis]|uniref:GGDEF domain-containing protein n=1 Tax=Actinoplanes nipponensis TaxID=135950 RepID=UPI00194186BA|nr:GGDEF domain-containing protein [Actinoplanes nipponensis]